MVLVMCMLTPCASMYAETEQSPYTYLNLDYATTTADDAAAVQLTEKDATFERSAKASSGAAEGIKEFGYDFRIQIDFKGNFATINRILLTSIQPVRVDSDEFDARIRSDFEQFVDMEKQLSALYSHPDRRFFVRERKSAGDKRAVYMFANGIWE